MVTVYSHNDGEPHLARYIPKQIVRPLSMQQMPLTNVESQLREEHNPSCLLKGHHELPAAVCSHGISSLVKSHYSYNWATFLQNEQFKQSSSGSESGRCT